MIHIVKNDTDLDIKNVICFYVSESVPDNINEVKKKKEEDWSYQDYLTDACDKLKYNLIWLNKHFVQFSFIDNIININDPISDVHISLDKDNIKDTIIFQGQANDEPGVSYIGLMYAFEYMGFFMINTYDEIRLASDKILSANILSSKNIPQPKYCLVTKNIMMDDNIKGNKIREAFYKLLDSIYDNNQPIDSKSKDIKYVVKILGGSLGIGVFCCAQNELIPILQAIFTLDPNRELIIQEYKENTGDIRAHAFSVDGKNYEILAVMKRNKIKGDFRSNVSLGAITSEIVLTDKQKEIILDTARLSGCRWVGVDLMDCEDGESVVIEYNSSPGVQGISQQIKQNMFIIILNKIKEFFENNKNIENPQVEYAKHTHAYVQYDPEQVDKCKKTWEGLSENRLKVLNKCLDFIPGTQYKLHGKHSPELGLDCSGYVKRVFKDALDIELPNMAVDYFTFKEANTWEKINKNDLKPGDIGILNDCTKNNHIGIYAGDDKWFENSSVYGVQLTNYSKFKYFFTIKEY